MKSFFRGLSVCLTLLFCAQTTSAAFAAVQDDEPLREIVPSAGPVTWTGEYTYDEAPELREKVGLPIYRWSPKGQQPRAIILAIHGLTLHARCYEVLARGFASAGFLFVAPDMRGYGACALPDAPEATRKINNKKSYEDIVKLAKTLDAQYPKLPIAMLGESLGTCFCVRTAAENHELVDAVIVAAPTSKVNPLMYMAPQTVFEGIKALFKPKHLMSYKVFFTELVSNNPEIIDELADDPLNLKAMPLGALIETQAFVAKTDKWAKQIKKDTPILILQGSKDRAMVPRAVTRLAKNIQSTDQTIRWMTGYGHLLLETDYLGPAALDAITDFIGDHDEDSEQKRDALYKEMKRFGAKALP